MDYSFVIPCYSSSKTIRSVVEEINSTMERLMYQFKQIGNQKSL